MSVKISVVSISLALVTLLFTSCSQKTDRTVCRVFEKPFCAELTVKNAEGEYCASVTLGAVPDKAAETNEADGQDIGQNTTAPRDGNVVYTSPDNITGISAVRTSGSVSVNVCGIEVVPSENIAQRYTYLLDLLDMRADEVTEMHDDEYSGRGVTVLKFIHGGEEVSVCIDKESGAPIYLDGNDIALTFDKFIYT